MATLTQVQRQQILAHLLKDKLQGYPHLRRYLLAIASNQAVDLSLEDTNLVLSLNAQDAWSIIAEFAASPEGNLPTLPRGSRTRQAKILHTHILQQLALNTEASARYHEILEQPALPQPSEVAIGPTNLPSANLTKALAFRRTQIDAYHKRLLNPLTQLLEQSPILQRIEDPTTRHQTATQLAALAPNLLVYNDQTPAELNQALLHLASPKLNNFLHYLHSDQAEKDLPQLVTLVRDTVDDKYSSRREFAKAADGFTQAVLLGTSLTDLPTIVAALAVNETPANQQAFVKALRRQITSQAHHEHLSGLELVQRAASKAGLNPDSPVLTALAPFAEEVEIAERSNYLGQQLLDYNPRQSATAGIAAALGISPDIPWLKRKDLEHAASQLLLSTKTSTLDEALAQELGRGSSADSQQLHLLRSLIDRRNQHALYQHEIVHNPLYAGQELFAKLNGNLAAWRQPYDQFVEQAWDFHNKIYDVVTYPQRRLFDAWDKLVENTTLKLVRKNGSILQIPLLDPMGFFYNQWVNVQKGGALRMFKFSAGLASRGKWYSPVFKLTASYSKAFFKNDANFAQTNFFFVEKAWGNLLNWGAQKAGHESWSALKKSVGKSIWATAKKIAPGLTAKIGSGLAKLAASLGLAEMTAGVSLAIQAGLFVLGAGINFVKNFLTNANFREKFLTKTLPALAALGGAWAALQAAGVAAVAAIAGLLSPIGLAILAAGALLVQALIYTTVGVSAFTLIYLVFTKMPMDLDPGPGNLLASIFCDESGNSGGDPTANAAVCIAEILTKAGLNPLFNTAIGGVLWQTVVSALANFSGAAAQLEASAGVSDGWNAGPHLQCVGLAAASAGAGFPQTDACNYATQHPSGWSPGPCKPGSLFVDASSCPGHIGVVTDCNAGAQIICVDANSAGAGVVQGPESCRWDKARVTVYLNRN